MAAESTRKLILRTSWDGVPPIAVERAAFATMVLTFVLNAAEVGAFTLICPTVFASSFSYTIRPE